jgi:7-cyano-7-deazaguanine synthase
MSTSRKSKKAVILFSGGLDSTTVLYLARKKGYSCHCLFFDYNQRHKKELRSAIKISKKLGYPLKIVKISLPWVTSPLIDSCMKIPDNAKVFAANRQLSTVNFLPPTYVPGRNTIFLSFAVSYAESIGAKSIFIGANAIDYSGYPDCRPKYISAWNKVSNALGADIKIEAPLLKMTKAQIIKYGRKLHVPYQLTWSCYAGGEKPCGKCDSCRFRAKGFEEAGVKPED